MCLLGICLPPPLAPPNILNLFFFFGTNNVLYAFRKHFYERDPGLYRAFPFLRCLAPQTSSPFLSRLRRRCRRRRRRRRRRKLFCV